MDKGCMAKAHCTLPRELERLTAENERLQQEFIDRAGDKAMERITQLTAEIRQYREVLEDIRRQPERAWEYADDALSVSDKQGFCYCKIGAGGKPCISREYCDATKQKYTMDFVEGWHRIINTENGGVVGRSDVKEPLRSWMDHLNSDESGQ